MNKRTIGSIKEEKAAEFLTECGLTVKQFNYRNRFGEIDIVAYDKSVLVFVEVKYRKTASAGHPEEAVNYKKARIISKVSDHYRLVHKIKYDTQIRFDVVAIEGDTVRWYQNAFPYIG